MTRSYGMFLVYGVFAAVLDAIWCAVDIGASPESWPVVFMKAADFLEVSKNYRFLFTQDFP